MFRWYQNPRGRAVFFQGAILAAICWLVYAMASNAVTNMAAQGKTVSLSFLNDVAPFGIGFSPLWDFVLGQSNYLEVFVIAIQNTILISVAGILTATVLGFVIGIARLSPNWIVSRLASVYIEIFRNVPLLLQIFFWYIAVFLPTLPPPRESWVWGSAAALNKEGAYLPRPVIESAEGFFIYCLILVLAAAALVFALRRGRRRQEQTGAVPQRGRAFAGFVLVAVAAYFLSGSPLTLEYPALHRFTYEGGIHLSTSFAVMWIALSTYTAAFIGEAVRGGILSVSHGQTEAAHALGLNRGRTLQLIVVPQAMRVIIPPTISQYLNLTKNSSLAIAVAYEELSALWMGVALNQTGQELLIIATAMAVYLVLSLTTSAFLNWYNNRVRPMHR